MQFHKFCIDFVPRPHDSVHLYSLFGSIYHFYDFLLDFDDEGIFPTLQRVIYILLVIAGHHYCPN